MKRHKSSASSEKSPQQVRVVCFGAAAGGVDAFSRILTTLDSNLGMAYILIMHMSPGRESVVPGFLQTTTTMTVHSAHDGIKVKKNNIYIIPANTFMTLIDERLKIVQRPIASSGDSAIDHFFSVLASTYNETAIGVILSGSVVDGTLGLKTIKAAGGIIIAQDRTAKYDSMPRSAYGYADFILSPEQIAGKLSELAKVPYTVSPAKKITSEQLKVTKDERTVQLQKVLGLIKNKFGVDFFLHYKQTGVYRRIVRRMFLNELTKLNDYYALLASQPKEADALYNDLLINVTSFFRDPDFFMTLSGKVFPDLLKKRKLAEPIRIWIAGCATGEEAYSVAISLLEFLEQNAVTIPLKIFASDLNATSIKKAKEGIYPMASLHGIPQNYINKYFQKIDTHFQVAGTLREICVFTNHDLLKDAPFSRMDLISCQNVLIYLETGAQNKILQMFHQALKSSGYLFLGKSETISTEGLFESVDKKIKIFSKKSTSSAPADVDSNFKSAKSARKTVRLESDEGSIVKDMDKLVLSKFVVPCIVVDQNFSIMQFFGTTSPYLSPPTGKASLNLSKIVREDLLIELITLIKQAGKTEQPAIKEGVKIRDRNLTQELVIEVHPRKKVNNIFFLIVFKENVHYIAQAKGRDEVEPDEQSAQTILKLQNELAQSRELIKTIYEEYESTYEELQANNKETLTSNKELQTVNEELEISREELQSANEELVIINKELHRRNHELKESRNYVEAIFQTMHSPLLVLTADFRVRIANKAFYNTFKLTPENSGDVFIHELGDGAWDIPTLRKRLNELMTTRSSTIDFDLKHYFPGLGELSFIVHLNKLLKENESSDTLILLTFDNVSELLKSNKELKKVNEQLEQFAFVSSHDLQEPLRKIETFSNFLFTPEAEMNSFAKKYAGKIRASASRLSTLLRDLLIYSMLLNKDQNRFAEVDLNEILKKIIYDFELIIKETNAKIYISVLPVIEADVIQMNQLFHHLISNALKFSKGGPVVNVESYTLTPEQVDTYPKLEKSNTYVAIQVRDNGVGFNPKYAQKIFGFFQRLNDKKSIDGTGMGLAICRKIVEDHGGMIVAEGKENEGAVFTVILPKKQ